MKVANDLYLTLSKGNIYVLALLYFSSSFDTIDHYILVHRLHTDFEFTDAVLQWFSSYLTERIHYVSLYNHCSAFAPVHLVFLRVQFLALFFSPCIIIIIIIMVIFKCYFSGELIALT